MAGEYGIRTERRRLTDIFPADYNPRKDLQPEDDEWKNIARSLATFGYVDPIIINQDGTIIGGHQRAKVLQAMGHKEVDVVVVDMEKSDEMALNIALNKIGGQWDLDKLKDTLQDIDTSSLDIKVTGFSEGELQLMLGDPGDDEEDEGSEVSRMTFVLTLEQYAAVEHARELIRKKFSAAQLEAYGNTNRKGNEIFRVVKEWVDAKTST
jgi:ParB-like chromosome segregation protein Spo0J